MPTQTNKAVWQGKRLSMQPVDPATGIVNPVTRILNMVLSGDNVVVKRRNFDAGASAAGQVQSHIAAELDGTPLLLVKTSSAVQASDGSGFNALINPSTTDTPLGDSIPNAQDRGSFSLHGGEVYYCDRNTIFAYDGNSDFTTRRPGVVSLQGRIYNEPLAAGGFAFGNTDDDYDAVDPLPEFICGEVGALDPCLELFEGEKSLNTGFCFAFYDPIRRIYGRRSEVFALPYTFGSTEPPPTDVPILLSPYRLQHAKRVRTPDLTQDYAKGHTEASDNPYLIAIWITRGFRPVSNQIEFLEGGWWVHGFWTPAMSKRMNQLLFLEGNDFPSALGGDPGSKGLDGAALRKDDSTLFASGRYIDTYSRPLPSKFMFILANGTALYLFPQVPEEPAIGDIEDITMATASKGNYAEYSVGHPEQISRHANTQQDTVSQIANLKGTPVISFSDGINQLLLTGQGIYRVGFDGGIILSEIAGGRGIRSLSSAQVSTTGVLWMADEGVVWYRGGSMILLDHRIGFSSWFEPLTNSARENVTIGAADVLNQILVFTENTEGLGTQRALCYDWQKNFASEFSNYGGTVNYAAHFRSNTGSHLWAFVNGASNKYPGPGAGTYPTQVELWLTGDENERDLTKEIKWLVIDFGQMSGSVKVTVDSHDHPDTTKPFLAQHTKTKVLTDKSGRITIPDFNSMRGRLFRILIEATDENGDEDGTSNWSLDKIEIEYAVDRNDDVRSF